MADRIEWFLNANSSQVRADMMATVQAVNAGTGQIVQGYNRADLASGNLLKSNSRVASSGIHVAQSMLAGGSAVDVFASSLMGLERATRLPLGALLGLGVAALAISKIHGVVVEFKALNKEAEELAKKDLTKLKMDELEKTKTEAESVKKRMEERGKSFVKGLINAVAENRSGGDPDPIARRADAMARGLHPGADPIWETQRPQRAAFEKWAAEQYVKQRLEDIPKEVDARIKQEKHEAEVGKEAASFKEKLQLSLADIAKGGRRYARGDDSTWGMGRMAQEAMKEETLAKKAILGEDYAGAVRHQSLAESLKAQIPGLKDSEKISTFKSALDTSERLFEISQKVGRELVNR